MYKVNTTEKESFRFKIFLKIIYVLVYIIIIPILIYNFTLIIKSFIFKDEIPDFFGYKNFVIISESMEPTINVGDSIFVKEVAEEDLKVNDIISYNINGEIITHRIVKIQNEDGEKVYITKGDNNRAEDKWKITYEDIEGKYIFKINGFGKFMEMLKSKVFLGILIILIILSIVYNNNLSKKKLIRKEKRLKYERK